MIYDLRCKLGFHKPKQQHFTVKHKFRTTNKGRSKKRYYTGIKDLYTITYCERCGKTLREKRKRIWK
ncbi:MAG: hypothetical protein IK144_12200 [Bacteroidaceae bacterium]|nr:hypothetical protein [Bacteroidaceae bacterium]